MRDRIVCVGWDGASHPILRFYSDVLNPALAEHQRRRLTTEQCREYAETGDLRELDDSEIPAEWCSPKRG